MKIIGIVRIRKKHYMMCFEIFPGIMIAVGSGINWKTLKFECKFEYVFVVMDDDAILPL